MKKSAIILATFVLFVSIISVTGCSSTTTAGTTAAAAVTTTTAASSITGAATTSAGAAVTGAADKTFTLDELKKYDGLNGNPAYVAVNGIVYDVTNVKAWNNGSHHTHSAGQDLSSVIASAPHGTSVLAGLPVVGKLVS